MGRKGGERGEKEDEEEKKKKKGGTGNVGWAMVRHSVFQVDLAAEYPTEEEEEEEEEEEDYYDDESYRTREVRIVCNGIFTLFRPPPGPSPFSSLRFTHISPHE
uniref:Uncharacterized protein n=1 Tax=Vespula pensylvanica TaxID=30213 RepID=A0A834MZU3_VESPE|nr:hypothetical protein H0235_017767 [Vespula pensylvanica]